MQIDYVHILRGNLSLGMENVESKTELEGQESQIMSETVEGFQQCVKEALDLIQQITPEIHDCKMCKLTKLVMELSRMYGTLADQHDHEVLLKKISVLEEELSTLNKKLQIPSDEKALLEAMKAKVADLIPVITEFDFKTEAIGKQALHEILKVKQEILLLQKYHASQQAKILHLQEKVKLGIAEISRRDEQITELNSKINKLINSHLDEEDGLNSDIESLDCWIGNGDS
ncbi:hypothetical protein LXL04_012116 [Taraxacum kok-saghyz]